MKSIKKMTAIMILAAVATMGTPQAFASTGIMLGDRAGTCRDGIMLGDRAGTCRHGIMLGDFAGIMLGDFAGIMLGD
jgi:hypothetical protein